MYLKGQSLASVVAKSAAVAEGYVLGRNGAP